MEERLTEKEEKFVKGFADFVNGRLHHKSATGHAMANAHRFLVNEQFEVILAFIERLAYDYKKGHFDPRNDWACERAAAMIEELEYRELYYSSLIHEED